MPLSERATGFYRVLEDQVLSGRTTLEAAVANLRHTVADFPEGLAAIDEALDEYNSRIEQIENLREPITFGRSGRPRWYTGPSDNDIYWPSLRTFLLEAKGWYPDIVKSVDVASTRVVFNLAPPGQVEFSTKGLVIGHVQSGKTANFTAVISKAADAGYRFFLVLSGMTNSLRQQTQVRLGKELLARHPQHWITWTDETSDIGDLPFNMGVLLDTNKRHLAVVKKNGPRLRRLLRMIKDTSETIRRNCPVLLIDDECDQASVNASGVRERITAINGLLRELLDELPRVAYVGYTATPYANVLIDPQRDDIYPRDFITSLPTPSDYFGAERLFGRDLLDADPVPLDQQGLDMIRLISEQEAQLLRPASRAEKDTFALEVTPALRMAVLYYWLTTAARCHRGDHDHSSMLVHTTVYARSHINSRQPLEQFANDIGTQLRDRDQALLSELRDIWVVETTRVPATIFGRQSVEFTELLCHLQTVIEDTEVVVENSLSDERLDFGSEGRRYIVIGGNVLARGLTLEGLVVSFFLRTSSQYDSLMQMGRWFGYRSGYEDFPRIWMTAEMADYFKDMATVEAEIRYDIATYEREEITPLDFPVRIRKHPVLAITARNKMMAAVDREVSFSGAHVQTRKFRHRNVEWLQRNWHAGAQLVDTAIQDREVIAVRGNKLIRDIPYTLVIRFLREYQVHEAHEDMRPDRLVEYVARQVENHDGFLGRWNLVVVGVLGSALSEESLGGLGTVNTIVRSRLEALTTAGDADIKALMSRTDAAIDFSSDFDVRRKDWQQLKEHRNLEYPDGRGLLLLYPINKESQPAQEGVRRALNAAGDVLGLAMVFPISPADEPVGYVSARIDSSRFEDAEYQEESVEGSWL